MSKYPKNIGSVLWLHFNLLIDVNSKTGIVERSIAELSEASLLPKKLIKPTLQELVKYGLISLQFSSNESFIIKLSYYGMNPGR